MQDLPTVTPIHVQDLGKRFGHPPQEVVALRDASFKVEVGEMVAVIGASGSGKSTLLHLLAGLTSASRGSVRIDGQDLSKLSDRKLTLFRRRHIGLIFQAFNLVPSLSVEDNLVLPLLMEMGAKPDAARVDELLKTLGISDRRRHRPDQLSGGEQQRVAVGRALINNPRVLLADEPTGNLDSVNGQRLCALFHALSSEQQRAVVVVTHDPAVAIWADRIIVLRDGVIVKELLPRDFSSPRELGLQFLDLMSTRHQEIKCA